MFTENIQSRPFPQLTQRQSSTEVNGAGLIDTGEEASSGFDCFDTKQISFGL